MECENQEKIYCTDDDEERIHCDICDKLSIGRYYNNHLKSRIHISNIRSKQPLKKQIKCM